MSSHEVASATPGALRRAVGIHHAAYRCRDAEQTRWFYEDVLGLPLAMCFVEEEVPGLRRKIPFMHLFFELGNQEYVAFFDQPGTARPEQFENADSFDRHLAFEVADEATLLGWQKRINAMGVSCLGPLDHGFVKSVYMYDPNGMQVELTTRTARHDQVMREEREHSRDVLRRWSERMRASKEERFGAAAIDLRSRQKPPKATTS
ncbi:MAG TPA: VOC family protein [Nevskiaceae bacterium]|nr:VOC family protein [Nevskiaceae bacterium]